MHDFDVNHEHDEESSAEHGAIAQLIREQDTVVLRTVGIDIGSSTSHLLFARVTLQRLSEDLSSRFVVVDRQVIWRSPIMLTPFLPDGSIDASALAHFIATAYADAGLHRSDIDSGAVILTGEAIKRSNARAIDDIFAQESGKFVCATAGHKLECILAAHGSGATAVSRRRSECGLHVDIGGGTTKLALMHRGEILGVAAFAVGGRLVAQDTQGAWTRIDESARLVAAELGLTLTPATLADKQVRKAIARRLAAIVIDRITGAAYDQLGQALQLTEPLALPMQPRFLTFSGGVAEYVFDRESADHGDIARLLAQEIVRQLKTRVTIPLIEPADRIRATVIGASQFTVQVSGKTIYLPDASVLPVHNIPVVHLGMSLDDVLAEAGDAVLDVEAIVAAFRRQADILDLDPQARLALAFSWRGSPEHARLFAMASAIMQFAAPTGKRAQPLFLMIDGDVASSLGRLLHDELHLDGKIVSIDGIYLRELDFVDVGEMMQPAAVVPIVIKSLLFPAKRPGE